MNIDDFWRCPNCGAGAGENHGGLGVSIHLEEVCKERMGSCEGMICDCDNEGGPEHGTASDPCSNAFCTHCGWAGKVAGKDDGTPNRVWVLMRYDKGEKVRSTGVFETAKDANARAKGERKRGIKCKVVKFRRDM